MFKFFVREVAAMGAIVTNLLYVLISLALVAVVGRALSRSGRELAEGRPGGAAASRLLVVAFYLLSAGFLALTLPVWTHVGSAGQAVQLLSVKVGELLLVLGGLHLASTAVLARLRRGPYQAAPPDARPTRPTRPTQPAPRPARRPGGALH